MLYQGLRPEAYYWEFVNTIRKVIMVAINVFMSTLPITYAALTAVLSLIFLIRVQIHLAPYKSELNNELEIEATIAGTATLFCGVLFIRDEADVPELVILILVILMIINIRFFLLWSLLFLSTVAKKSDILLSTYNLLATLLFRRKFSKELLTQVEQEGQKNLKKPNSKPKPKKRKYKHKKIIKFAQKQREEEFKVSFPNKFILTKLNLDSKFLTNSKTCLSLL